MKRLIYIALIIGLFCIFPTYSFVKSTHEKINDNYFFIDGTTNQQIYFPGSGNASDPYRIENLNLNSCYTESFIFIQNEAKYFNLKNITFRLPDYCNMNMGIFLENDAHFTIENISVYNFNSGSFISIRGGSAITVNDVKIYSTSGITVDQNSSYIDITNNNIKFVSFNKADHFKIENNTVGAITIVSGLDFYVTNNTVIYTAKLSSVRLEDCHSGMIIKNTFYPSIGISGGNNLTLFNNKILNRNYGIGVSQTTNDTFRFNTILHAHVGFGISSSNNDTFSFNTISNGHIGFEIYMSNNTNYIENTIINVDDGFIINRSSNLLLKNNNFQSVKNFKYVMDDYSINNIIIGDKDSTTTNTKNLTGWEFSILWLTPIILYITKKKRNHLI